MCGIAADQYEDLVTDISFLNGRKEMEKRKKAGERRRVDGS